MSSIYIMSAQHQKPKDKTCSLAVVEDLVGEFVGPNNATVDDINRALPIIRNIP